MNQEVETVEKGANLERLLKWTIAIVASVGVLFHMYTGGIGAMSSMVQTVMHWTVMLALLFLIYPKKRKRNILDVVLFAGVLVCGIYILLTWLDRANRISPTLSMVERIFGVAILLLVLEGTRRSTGTFLTVTAIIFIIYAKVGPYLPGILFHKGYSFDRILSVLCYSENGIFGSALSTSATFIVLFVIFGSVLNACNGGKLFIDIAYAVTGGYRGGPAKTAILSSLLMGCISGSPVANVVTTGTFTIPLMKRAGYSSEEACAVEAVASTGGQIMPPVMGAAAFIMAEYTGTKYGTICVSAFIPAMLYYLALFFIVDFISVKKGLRGQPRNELPHFRNALHEGAHLFIPIVALIACLIYGFSAMKTVFYATLALILISQIRPSTRISPKKTVVGLQDGIIAAVSVAVSCACAGIIVGMVSLTGLGVKFSSSLIDLSGGNIILALVYTMLASLVLGCGLPTTAVYIILASLAAPALTKMGLPMLAAHMFVFYFGCISTITPPVALTSFAAAGIGGASAGKTGLKAFGFGIVAYIVPYMFVLSPALLAQDSLPVIIRCIFTAVIGVFILAAGIAGYLRGHLNILFRIILLFGGIMLISGDVFTDFIGIGILVLVWGYQTIKLKRVKEMDNNVG